MNNQYWLERWESNEIRFNQDKYNNYLVKYKEKFGELKKKKVFIPLCGKTIDIIWFLEQGAEVIGVELSPRAIEDFFKEFNIKYKINDNIYEANNLKLICGDLFSLQSSMIGQIDWIYDRASLIALSPEIQFKYAIKLNELSNLKTKIFLITLTFNTPEPSRPPYSITFEDVNKLFSNNFKIEKIAENKELDIMTHLEKRGVSNIVDRLYFLEKVT